MKTKQEVVWTLSTVFVSVISGVILIIISIPSIREDPHDLSSVFIIFIGLFCLFAAAYFFWENRREKRLNAEQEQEDQRDLAEANRK